MLQIIFVAGLLVIVALLALVAILELAEWYQSRIERRRQERVDLRRRADLARWGRPQPPSAEQVKRQLDEALDDDQEPQP